MVLGAAIGLLPVAPPAHVHEGEDHGHVKVVIHRHLDSHGLLENHDTDHQRRLADDDRPILTLSPIYTSPAALVLDSPPRTAGKRIELLPSRPTDRRQDNVEILIHGPPRAPTPLRAPPFFPSV